MANVFGKRGNTAQMYMEGGFMGGIALGKINLTEAGEDDRLLPVALD